MIEGEYNRIIERKKKVVGKMDEERLKALVQKTRLKIIGELRKRPTHSSDLAQRLELDRVGTVFHLGILENAGLIRGEFKILEKAHPKRAAKVFSVDEGVLQETLDKHQEMLSQANP